MISTRFRTKILLVTVLPVVITSIILAYILISGRVDEFNKRTNDQGNNIANYLSIMSEYGIFSNSFEYLESALTHTLKQKNIVAIYIEDRNKSIVLKKLNDKYENIDIRNIDKEINKTFTSSIRKTSIVIDDVSNVIDESSNNNAVVGTVNIVMNLNDAQLLKTQIIKDGIITTFILTLATIFIALLFSRSVTKPISKIYTGVNIIKQGSLQHRIPVNFSGELAVLAKGINNMTSSLEAAHSKEKQRKEALINAKQEAERANRAKSLFLSSMSHELRTPLNAILGFGQLLEAHYGDISKETGKEYINNILRAGYHLIDLINQVLDLSRIEAGHLNIKKEWISLSNIVTECVSQIDISLANKSNITVTNKIDEPQIMVLADSMRLKQVIINLLSNAVKYNKKGGSVTIETEPAGKDRLRILVIDTGDGIAASDLEKLFDPFERLSFKSGTIEGTGIGLTVAKQLVEAMDGYIGVESVIAQGSTFWVELATIENRPES